VRAQILEELIKGHLGFGLFIRLVFTRVIKVIVVCLVLTLIVWLVWLGKYTLASFLAGGVLGFLAFLILCFLKHHSGSQKTTESSSPTDEVRNVNEPEEIKPKASV